MFAVALAAFWALGGYLVKPIQKPKSDRLEKRGLLQQKTESKIEDVLIAPPDAFSLEILLSP